MDRSISALVVAILCVLAGCNGFAEQEDAGVEETITPAPVPTVATESAPEVSENGINAPAIAANHRAALASESYTARTRLRWQNRNGSTFADTTVHRVESGGERYHVTAEYARPQGSANLTEQELWFDGNRTITRVENAAGEEEFQQLDPDPTVEYPRARMISDLFSRLEPGDVRQTSDGATVVRGPLEGVDELRGLSKFRDETNATMAARITPEGYVDRVAIGFDATVQGRPVEARVTIEFINVGSTTVSEPAWVENVTVSPEAPTTLD